jgi:hypothetical protein
MKRTNFQICKSMLCCVLYVLHLLYSPSVVHSRQIMSVIRLMIYKEFNLLMEYGIPCNNAEVPITRQYTYVCSAKSSDSCYFHTQKN